jgi:putative addiction module component (TIGR02574 family)
MAFSTAEILKLTVEERLQLIETIWNSIATGPEGLPLTDAQRREIDRRLERYAADPTRLSSWDEVRARIEAEG